MHTRGAVMRARRRASGRSSRSTSTTRAGRAAAEDGGLRALPLRRPHRHRRPPARHLPIAGGHEGAGIVERSARTRPAGRSATTSCCRSCPAAGAAAGARRACRTCATSAPTCSPAAAADGSLPHDASTAQPVGQMCGISHLLRAHRRRRRVGVKIDKDIPLEKACLVGCGVGTGWGSAVNAAEVAPGDTVIVMGVGGIGINAVQGAAHAGATHVIAVDPVEFKREKAHGARRHPRLRDDGRGHRLRPVGHQRPGRRLGDRHRRRAEGRAHRPRRSPPSARPAPSSSPPSATCTEVGIPIPLVRADAVPEADPGRAVRRVEPVRTSRGCSSMYQTASSSSTSWSPRTYTLDEINQGYADMHAGKNIRGVIVY